MVPKIVDKEERRREICLAAIDLFSHKGYEHVTIKEIAEASGIGKGTVYEYFDCKKDILLKSTKQFFFELMDDEVFKSIDFSNPIEGIKAFARETVRLFRTRNSDFFLTYLELLLVNLRNERSEDMCNDIKDIFYQYCGLLQNVMDEGKAKGVIPSHLDTRSLALSLFAYLDGLMFHSWLYDTIGEEIDFEKVNENFIGTFLKGLTK